jgi:hypothetical protein
MMENFVCKGWLEVGGLHLTFDLNRSDLVTTIGMLRICT